VDFLAHEIVGLLPRGIPQSVRLPIIRDFLDEAERIIRKEGVAVPPWVQRARELYLGDEPAE
jgi:hypothetical protein